MCLTVESEDVSRGSIEENPFYWGEEVPKELQEEATLVSKLALNLFQKLKVHPDVYVPSNKNKTKDWCKFFWRNNHGQFGGIDLEKDTVIQKGKKIELPVIRISILYEKGRSTSPYIHRANFSEKESIDSGYTVMPKELQNEAENLVKISSRFFRKLVEHPDVITIDGGYYMENWEKFCCYDRSGAQYGKISFSDSVSKEDRIQRLMICKLS